MEWWTNLSIQWFTIEPYICLDKCKFCDVDRLLAIWDCKKVSNLENGNESWWRNSMDVITSLEYKNMCIFGTCFESIVKVA